MDWLWIPFALTAAFIQALRFMVQKQMAQAGLTAVGATWARFLYSLPLVWLALWALSAARGMSLPALEPGFWLWALVGGTSQILATVFTVMLFARRNFAVGITLRKSEVLLTVAVGWALLGETPGWAGFGAMVAGSVAILMLSGTTTGRMRLDGPSALLGLGAGLFFAFSGVGYRAATLAVATEDIVMRPLLALACVVTLQTLAMLAWFAFRDRAEIRATLAAWRPGLAVGLTSFGGSFCWFAAFALQSAAVVFALGQVEVLFSMVIGARVFSERLAPRETAGIALLIASVVVLVAVTT